MLEITSQACSQERVQGKSDGVPYDRRKGGVIGF